MVNVFFVVGLFHKCFEIC